MRIDADLLLVAAKNSISKDLQKQNQAALKSWIRNLSANEKNNIVFRLINDHDPHLGTELIQRFQKEISAVGDDAKETVLRSAEDLLEAAEAYAADRARKKTEKGLWK